MLWRYVRARLSPPLLLFPAPMPHGSLGADEPEIAMKPEIHPEYKDATITCACGSSVQTHSTSGSFSVDICSQCHPFYTGKQRIADTAGRVERFRRKYGKETPKPADAEKAPSEA